MHTLALLAFLLTFSAMFGVINHCTRHLPTTIGMLVFSMSTSLLLMVVEVHWLQRGKVVVQPHGHQITSRWRN